jgi:hypothetical protein
MIHQRTLEIATALEGILLDYIDHCMNCNDYQRFLVSKRVLTGRSSDSFTSCFLWLRA